MDPTTEIQLQEEQDLKEREMSAWGISPFHFARRLWEWIMFITCTFTLWEVAFEWIVSPPLSLRYALPALVVDVLYFIDIFVVTRTGVMISGVVCLDKATIKRSVSTWKIVIMWIAPWPLYMLGFASVSSWVFKVLLLIKCVRLFRLYDSYKTITVNLIYITPFSKLTLLMLTFLSIIHVCACSFLSLGLSELPGPSWMDYKDVKDLSFFWQYIYSFYYMTTTILTIGYGDLHPATYPEIVLNFFIETVGIFFNTYMISKIVTIVADPDRNQFNSEYQRVITAIQAHGIKTKGIDQLQMYYEFLWDRTRDMSGFDEMLSKMPDGLQKRICLAVHIKEFLKTQPFRDLQDEQLEMIAVNLNPVFFAPDDILCTIDVVSNRMIFITHGRVQLIGRDGVSLSEINGETGTVIGESSVLSNEPEAASAVAETFIEAYELKREDLEKIPGLFLKKTAKEFVAE